MGPEPTERRTDEVDWAECIFGLLMLFGLMGPFVVIAIQGG
jgi:hypothetical protein